MKNIAELFLNAAKKYPTKIAIIESNKKISFAELKSEVIHTAAYLKKKGIRLGDRVLIFVPMSIDLYRVVLALFYLGASAVFLDEWVSKKRMELCCKIANCMGFIGVFKAQIFAFFSSELRKIPVKVGLNFSKNEQIEMTKVPENKTALITFTTGSTGTPKAADRSHSFLAEQFSALLHEINPKPNDIDMTILPIVLFINLGVGCTSVIAKFKGSKPEKMKPKKILEQINQHKINRISASPFFIKKLATYKLKHKIKTNTLTQIFTGGAPVFPSEAILYLNGFPKTKFTIVYGSTESEPISSISATNLYSNFLDVSKNGLCVGNIYPKAEVKFIKITDKEIHEISEDKLLKLCVEVGSIGEIIVSGHHVLKNYFNNDTAFRENKIICNGKIWHRTGDSGRLIKNNIFLTGRCAQLIFTPNQIISPFIYENILQEITGVSIGTVLEIKHQLVIVIETMSGFSKKNIETEIHEQKINFSTVRFIKKIPRDPRHNSKIDYVKLKNLLKKYNTIRF